ncbi:hypothetical protein D3C77_791510 [compost metagenome]
MTHWDGDTFAFAPAGEADLVDSLASVVFKTDPGQGQASGLDIKFYDDGGLGRWVRK